MPRPSIRIDGLDDVRRAIRQARNTDLPRELRQANKAIADEIADKARAAAPVRTGRLAASIRSRATQKSASVAAGGARVPYAGAIHWGWRRRHIAPRPFLTAAAQSVERESIDRYTEAVEAVIRRINT